MDSHQRRCLRRMLQRYGVSPRSNPAPMPTPAPAQSAEKHIRDYLMGGIALLADYLAFRFVASWLAWAAAFLFWMAIYDYAKSKTPPLIRRGAPIGAALVLIPITVAITGSFVIKRHTLNTKGLRPDSCGNRRRRILLRG